MMKQFMAGALMCAAVWMAGCNGGGDNGGGGGGGTGNQVAVTVSPPGVLTQLNQQVQFSAFVQNAPTLNIASSNGAVRNNNVVTITTTTSHSFVVGQTVTIQGVADVSFTGTFTIASVPNNTSFTYNQTGSNAMSGGGTIPNNAVTWQVNNVAGGNSMVGTISPTGLYTAPSVLIPAVTATIASNGAVRNNGTVTITTTAAHMFTAGQIVSISNVTAVNPLTATITANGAVRTNNSVTITTTAAHMFTPGQLVTLTGVGDASFNGAFLILSTPSSTSFTFSQVAADASSGGGMASVPVGSFNGTFVIATVPSTTTFTYPQNGANATSGGGIASSAAVQVKAISAADTTKEGTASVVLDSGIILELAPGFATIGTGEQIQFTARNLGPTPTAINWFVNDVAGGNSTVGTINVQTPAGATSTATYTAPAAVPTPAGVTIRAQAAADATKTIQASVTVSSVTAGTAPTVAQASPLTVAQGAAPTDFYIAGTNFLTTTEVRFDNMVVPQANVTAVTSTLIRARIPASFFDAAGTFPLTVTTQGGSLPAMPVPVNVNVTPQRPALISTTPNSVQQNLMGGITAQFTGGYYTSSTTAFVKDTQVLPSLNSSTQLDVPVSAGLLNEAGLIPITVVNSSAAQPWASVNLAVQPAAGPSVTTLSLPTGGMMPSSVAVNYATGFAIVTNRGSHNVSCINLATNAVSGPNPVGTPAGASAPTGVAVDSLRNIAVVANNGTNTISLVNMATCTQTAELGPVGPMGTPFRPVAVGVNPITGVALVANGTTNTATVIDVANGVVLGTVPGVNTGGTPEVAVDTRLNWAVVTPGGAGTASIVDLGRQSAITAMGAVRSGNTVTITTASPHGLVAGQQVTISGVANASFNGLVSVVSAPSTTTFTYAQTAADATSGGGVVLSPSLLATMLVGVNVRGIGVNPETHTAIMVDPTTGAPVIFSLLDQFTSSVPAGSGYAHVAVNPLTNIAVEASPGTNQIQLIDLRQPAVLGTTLTVGMTPRAVAIDAGTNRAIVANEGSNDVSIVSLGAIRTPHIIQSSPLVTMSSGANLTLTIIGEGLTGGTVRLDGTGIATTVVSSRMLTATVPAAMLNGPRRYTVDVQTGGGVSNVSELSVVHAVAVGTAPSAVAIDSGRSLAVVTNSGSNNLSFVDLTTGALHASLPAPLPLGMNANSPQGVALIPRLGRAVVTNFASNTASLVQYFNPDPMVNAFTGTVTMTVNTGTGPLGVAINPNDGQAIVANSGANTVSLFSSESGIPISSTVETRPTAIAIDPVRNIAAVTHTTSNSVVLLGLPGATNVGRTAVASLPEGIVYDAESDRFVVASALSNNLTLVNPNGAATQVVRVGINPTSIAHNRNSSTLVTMNSASNTMSVVDFRNFRVREVLNVLGAPRFAVAIDEQTNIAVVVDQANNRVLLIQLPR